MFHKIKKFIKVSKTNIIENTKLFIILYYYILKYYFLYEMRIMLNSYYL